MTPDTKPSNIYEKVIQILRAFYSDIKKYKAVFFLTLIVINGLLLFLNNIKSNVYKASFTVIYEELVRKIYGDRIEKLDRLLDNNDKKAKILLSLNDEQIKTFKSIEATNILGEQLSKDLNIDKIPFMINIYVTDSVYITDIQNSVISYLENGNKYLKEVRALKFKEIDAELNYLNHQLNLLDSLKRKTNSSSAASSSSVSSTQDYGSVYEVSYELYKKKQELLKKKEMPHNLYVVDDAMIPVKMSKSVFLVVSVGLIISILTYIGLVYVVIPVVKKEV